MNAQVIFVMPHPLIYALACKETLIRFLRGCCGPYKFLNIYIKSVLGEGEEVLQLQTQLLVRLL